MVLETTACASVLTLVILTVERFRAICISSDSLRATQSSVSPTESIHMKRIAIRNILIIWILSVMAATPLTVYTRINYLVVGGQPLLESAWCGLPFNAPNRVWQNFMVMSTVAFFIIPLIVITLLYSLIGRTLRRANRIPNPDFQLTDQCSSRKIMKSRTIVVRLLGKLSLFPGVHGTREKEEAKSFNSHACLSTSGGLSVSRHPSYRRSSISSSLMFPPLRLSSAPLFSF